MIDTILAGRARDHRPAMAMIAPACFPAQAGSRSAQPRSRPASARGSRHRCGCTAARPAVRWAGVVVLRAAGRAGMADRAGNPGSVRGSGGAGGSAAAAGSGADRGDHWAYWRRAKIYVRARPGASGRTAIGACSPTAHRRCCWAAHASSTTARDWLTDGAAAGSGRPTRCLPELRSRLDLAPDRLAYIYYTSGSTGRPKGVADCHRNVLHNILRYTDSLRIGCAGPAHPVAVLRLQRCRLQPVRGSAQRGMLPSDRPCRPKASRVSPAGSRPSGSPCSMRAGDLPRARRHRRRPVQPRVIRLEGDLAGPTRRLAFQRRFGTRLHAGQRPGRHRDRAHLPVLPRPRYRLPPDGLPVGHPAADIEIAILGEDGSEVGAGRHRRSRGAQPVSGGRVLERPCADGRAVREAIAAAFGATGAAISAGVGRSVRSSCSAARISWSSSAAPGWIWPRSSEALLELPGVKDAAVVRARDGGGRAELVAYVVPAGMHRRPTRPTCGAGLARRCAGAAGADAMALAGGAAAGRQRQDRPGEATSAVRVGDPVQADGAMRIVGAAGGKSWAHERSARISRSPRQAATRSRPSSWHCCWSNGCSVRATGSDRARVPRSPSCAGAWPRAAATLRNAHGRGRHRHAAGAVPWRAWTSVAYQALVPRLAPWRPVYGVRRARSRLACSPPVTVPSLAARYAASFGRSSAMGPARLAGNCLGGVLALGDRATAARHRHRGCRRR